MREITLTVLGKAPRKSNSRQIVSRGRGGRPMLIKSKEAREYEKAFSLQVTGKHKLGLGSKEHPIKISADVFYPWQTRGDLSGELIMDCLTKAGVIADDRFVVHQEFRKRYDKENSRVEIVVTELDKWDWEGHQ